MKISARDLWLEFLTPEGLCGLCGNHGLVTTAVVSPAGVRTGVFQKHCICPNGRALRHLDELEKQT